MSDWKDNLKSLIDFKSESKARNVLIGLAAGLGSVYVARKLIAFAHNRKYLFPIEIDANLRDKYIQGDRKQFEKFLTELTKKYPNECTINLGRLGLDATETKIVILNSMEAVNGFSANENIGNRPQILIFDLISHHYLGSFFRMNDDKLREVRKSSIAGLHKLVLSDAEFESKVFDELTHFIQFISGQFVQRDVNIFNDSVLVDNFQIYCQQLVSNLLILVAFGMRFDYELGENCEIKKQISNMTNLLQSVNLIDMCTITSFSTLFEHKSASYFVKGLLDSLYTFLGNTVNFYKSSYDPAHVQTFADFLLSKHTEAAQAKGNLSPSDNYSEEDILVQVFTLLMAGAGTTGFTLSWAFYHLAKDQDLQNALLKESFEVSNSAGFLSWKERPKMKYTEGFISEILRLSSTQALIARATPSQVKVKSKGAEYLLPENTTVMVNSYGIHHDESYWHDPFKCVPERWFDHAGNTQFHSAHFVPFGTAPRTCIGDNLSKLLLFSIVTNVLKEFKMELVDGDVSQSQTFGTIGVMRSPTKMKIRFIERKTL